LDRHLCRPIGDPALLALQEYGWIDLGFRLGLFALYCCGRNRQDNVYRERKTRLRPRMEPREHIRVTGFALKNWAVAQVQDSIAVALLWLLGLWILKVPWAPLWAALAAALQIGAPLRTSTQSGRPGAGGIAPLAGLGTSPLRADPVRSNRSRGRPVAPALHHASHCQSSYVGLDSGTNHTGFCNSVLGIHSRSTAAGSDICLQSKRARVD